MQDDKKSGKVKKGFLAVQVGLDEAATDNNNNNNNNDHGNVNNTSVDTLERFVIPIWYLYDPRFITLLDRASEVYGYHVDGPLRLPCSVDDFIHLRWQIEREHGGRHLHHHHDHQVHHHYFHPHATSFRSC